jgi:hypothetical protein
LERDVHPVYIPQDYIAKSSTSYATWEGALIRQWLFLLVLVICVPLAINLIAKFLIAPFRIRRTQTILANPPTVETQSDHLTPELREFLGDVVREFTAAGFDVAVNVNHPGMVPGITGFQILFVNRRTNDLAMVLMGVGANVRFKLFGLTSQFSGGRRVVTTNNPKIGMYPSDPISDAINFSWARDVASLHEAHRRRLAKLGRGAQPRIAPAPGKELAYLDAEREREAKRAVDNGYRYLEHDGVRYRFTMKGAFLSTWKIVQPIQRWRIALRDRKARRLWNELGMDSWRPEKKPLQFPRPVETVATARTQMDDSKLGYEVGVAAGDSRTDQTDAATTIRFGNPSIGQVVLRKWFTILVMVVLGLLIGLQVRHAWIIWKFYSRFGSVMTLRRPPLFRPAILFYLALIMIDAWRIWRALARASGTAILEASHEGLRFTNAAGRPRAGMIPRKELDQFVVRVEEAGPFTKLYRLQATRAGSARPLVLLVGSSATALQSVRSSLARAMGIEAAPTPPPLPAVVADV